MLSVHAPITERSQFVLFDEHYEAYQQECGETMYLDMKDIPMGLFGSVIARVVEAYRLQRWDYQDHFKLDKHDNAFRVVFLFKKNHDHYAPRGT